MPVSVRRAAWTMKSSSGADRARSLADGEPIAIDRKDGAGCMFDHASSFNQPLGAWDVGRAEDMSCMFTSASSINQPLASWDVRRVTDFKSMVSFPGGPLEVSAHAACTS